MRYQLITKALLTLIVIPLAKLASTWLLQATGQGFYSSGELGAFLTPAGVALSLVALVGASIVMGIDLFAFVHISAHMRMYGEALGIRQALARGLKSLPRFANPAGVVADPTLFASSNHTAIIAHRAGGDLGPENTIPGMEAATAAHADGVEIDVQRTKDGATSSATIRALSALQHLRSMPTHRSVSSRLSRSKL